MVRRGSWTGVVAMVLGACWGTGPALVEAADSCPLLRWQQPPAANQGFGNPSNLDGQCLSAAPPPNAVLADDFTVDDAAGAVITHVAWYGSYLDPAFEPGPGQSRQVDGWFIGLHADDPGNSCLPGPLLGLYWIAGSAVVAADTATVACDSTPVFCHRASLSDGCLVVQASPLAAPDGFHAQAGRYWISIQAEVGYRTDCASGGVLFTGTLADGPFWSWHSTPIGYGHACAAQRGRVDINIGPAWAFAWTGELRWEQYPECALDPARRLDLAFYLKDAAGRIVWFQPHESSAPDAPLCGSDTAPKRTFPPASASLATQTLAGLLLQLAGQAPISISLIGDLAVRYGNPETAAPGIEAIPTELLLLSLSGNDPVLGEIGLQLDTAAPSIGQIIDTDPDPQNSFPAESYLDVFVELTLPEASEALQVLRSQGPMRITASPLLLEIPPGGGIQYSASAAVNLVDSDDQVVGQILAGVFTLSRELGAGTHADIDWGRTMRSHCLNRTAAADFTGDGRPICRVEWWGTYLDPRFAPVQYGGAGSPTAIDGWLVRFYAGPDVSPPEPGCAPEELLGTYFVPAEAVVIIPAGIRSCEQQPIYHYTASLASACMIRADADPRNQTVPAAPDAFMQQPGYRYWLAIQAVAGLRIECPSGAPPAPAPTANTADQDYWGWLTSPTNLLCCATAGRPAPVLSAPFGLTNDWRNVADRCDPSRPCADQAFALRSAAAPCNRVSQDIDADGDVDLGDFLFFQDCFNGPNRPYSPLADQQACYCNDQDRDDDVDLTDFLAFQECFNGPNRPAACRTDPCSLTPQDLDGDGDVDLGDFLFFQDCFNGPNRPYPPPADQRACLCSDQDRDNDVDLTDFLAFQACFNGPNRPVACPP